MNVLAARGTDVVAVDLAAKYSAACHLDRDGTIHGQVDSWDRTETGFIDEVTAPWLHTDAPAILLVEDLPYSVRYSTITKTVCRLQGRIAERMDYLGSLNALYFVSPTTWRRHFPGLENGTGPDAVRPVAEALGYRPPDLSHRILKSGDRAIARKVATDYCAAWLIARFLIDKKVEHGDEPIPGLLRHGQSERRATRPRKKEPPRA